MRATGSVSTRRRPTAVVVVPSAQAARPSVGHVHKRRWQQSGGVRVQAGDSRLLLGPLRVSAQLPNKRVLLRVEIHEREVCAPESSGDDEGFLVRVHQGVDIPFQFVSCPCHLRRRIPAAVSRVGIARLSTTGALGRVGVDVFADEIELLRNGFQRAAGAAHPTGRLHACIVAARRADISPSLVRVQDRCGSDLLANKGDKGLEFVRRDAIAHKLICRQPLCQPIGETLARPQTLRLTADEHP